MEAWRIVPQNVRMWDEKRMVEVIQLFADGEESRTIAEKFGVQIETLRKHLMRWFQETGTENTRHLIAYGFRKGLIR